MLSKYRLVINIFFLVLIIALMLTGTMKLWMALLVLSVLTLPLFGRLYCGWICPVFTSIKLWERFIFKMPGQKDGRFFASRSVRVVLFIIFLGIFIVLNKFESPIPFFILLIPPALIFTYIFGQGWWHRICPFGILYSLENRFFKKGYRIGLEKCTNCGLCVSHCPGMCLEVENRKIEYAPEYCLSCGECVQYCPGKKVKKATATET